MFELVMHLNWHQKVEPVELQVHLEVLARKLQQLAEGLIEVGIVVEALLGQQIMFDGVITH